MNQFKTIFLEEAVFFLDSLPEQARDKVLYNIYKVEGGVRNSDLFKKLEGTEIWEFRTLYNGIQYRLFAFWDTDKKALVVATHGIIKKVWKVPTKEIAKAEEIRKNGTATARQSDSNETLDMKSDTEEDAEKETKGGKRQAVQ